MAVDFEKVITDKAERLAKTSRGLNVSSYVTEEQLVQLATMLLAEYRVSERRAV